MSPSAVRFALRAGFAMLLATGTALAHPISISQENVFVSRDKVVVTMQVFAEDLVFFHDLRPDDLGIVAYDELKEAVPKHAKLLLDRVRLIDANGDLLKGTTTKVDDEELEPPGYKVAELQYKKLAFTMEYPLETPPEFLTFAQEIVGLDAAFPSEVQLNVKQAGTPLEETRALRPAAPFTMRFEWDDVLPSDAATNDAEREKWLARQREKTLGITDYETAYSFLYVTDRGVRHEVLIPFVTLESFIQVERGKRAFLEVEEQPAAREQIGDFFKNANPVEIDGVPVTPVVDRVEFFEVDFRDFAQRPEEARIATANSRVGVILSYPAKSPPGHVKVTWDQWSRQLREVRSVGFAYEERLDPRFTNLPPDRRETFEWTNPAPRTLTPVTSVAAEVPPTPRITLPIVSVIAFLVSLPLLALGLFRSNGAKWLGGAVGLCVLALATFGVARVSFVNPFVSPPEVDDERSHAVARTLLANTYRAFDYRDAEDVYAALAHSIEGPLLKETYLRVNEALRMQDQGGAISLVDEVVVKEGAPVPLSAADRREHGPGFQYECTWTVAGTVEHWGHVHGRTNQYVAMLTIRAVDEEWKITDLEILDEERVGTSTSLRTF